MSSYILTYVCVCACAVFVISAGGSRRCVSGRGGALSHRRQRQVSNYLFFTKYLSFLFIYLILLLFFLSFITHILFVSDYKLLGCYSRWTKLRCVIILLRAHVLLHLRKLFHFNFIMLYPPFFLYKLSIINRLFFIVSFY